MNGARKPRPVPPHIGNASYYLPFFAGFAAAFAGAAAAALGAAFEAGFSAAGFFAIVLP